MQNTSNISKFVSEVFRFDTNSMSYNAGQNKSDCDPHACDHRENVRMQ